MVPHKVEAVPPISIFLLKGVELVAEALGLEDAIRNADLILTGEGRYDAQTLHGKVVRKPKH